MGEKVEFVVKGLGASTRLDKVLRAQFPHWGRRAIKTTLNARKVKVNRKTVWLGSWEVMDGDQITVTDPPKDKPRILKTFDSAWIVAEEEDLIIVNKPAGLRSQATRAGGGGNLLSLAETRFGEVHLFHRLDRDTSGICLLTRPGPMNAYLDRAFKEGTVEKEYLAVVKGGNRLDIQGVISTRMDTDPKRRDRMVVVEKGGKHAETRYKVIESRDKRTLVGLWPVTGRTHQLRVHMQYLGTPILGDLLYGGGEEEAPRLILHAYKIVLPEGDGFPKRKYQAEVPDDFPGEFKHIYVDR
ncbi:MAG: RluA family pseudouridine synthase [Anaerolineales bacterium]